MDMILNRDSHVPKDVDKLSTVHDLQKLFKSCPVCGLVIEAEDKDPESGASKEKTLTMKVKRHHKALVH